MEGLAQEFAGNPQDWKTAQSAHYAERRQRAEMQKAARFITCGILDAEQTEFRVRARLNKLGIPVRTTGIDFGPSRIVFAAIVIYVAAFVGCLVAAAAYHMTFGTSQGLVAFLGSKKIGFALWSLLWVVAYVLPILLAAGVSMEIMDRINDAGALTHPGDRATDLALTFLGAALVAFFPVLIARVIEGLPLSMSLLVEVLPWVIGPASLATAFVWISTPARQGMPDKPESRAAYVSTHAAAAAAGSALALMLWIVFGGKPQGADAPQLVFFLMPIVGALVGAAIGLVLSSTRIQPTAPAAKAPGAG